MVKNVGEGVKVKASGGISGLDDAAKFLAIGAKRLGTSRVVKAAKNADADKREADNSNTKVFSQYMYTAT